MVNEGLAGGTINNKYKEPEVDEARSLEQEVRPRKSNSD